jgi:hypothetical protein
MFHFIRLPLLAAVITGLALTPVTTHGEDEKALHAEMRGFGKVDVSSEFFGEASSRSSSVDFKAEDPHHATLIGSKYIADLLGFGDVKLRTDTGLPGTVLELPGTGLWLIGQEEARCHVLFAHSQDKLADLAKQLNASTWKPIPEHAYPRWMDCFDNAGTGIWYGGGGAPVDIDAEFPWMKQRGFSYCDQPPVESRYVAPGVIDTTYTDWFGAKCKEFDLPYRTLLWKHSPEWAWNRTPLPYVKAAPGFSVPHADMNWSRLSITAAYEPVPQSDVYIEDFRRRFTQGLNEDPNVLGYHAIGEVPDAGVMELAAVAGMPETKAAWHDYLKNVLGFDLAAVGLAHRGDKNAYPNWDAVTVPVPRDFMGFDSNSVDLTGTWEGLPDHDRVGADAKWYAPESMPKEGWTAVDCNDPMLLIYGGGVIPSKQKNQSDYWLRRKITLTAPQLDHLKYLHIQRALWAGSAYSTFCEAYLNGQPLQAIARDESKEMTVCFAVGTALRAGDNQLVLCMHGSPPAGFITLGPLPARQYPAMTETENRRWFDAVNFSAWYRLKAAENYLRAMRTGDPDRPFKMMATINLLDMSEELCAKYGAYQHDTGGAGGYWCPMTGARLAKSHGLPWSCEQGGPPENAEQLQGSMTFYLMYGNDAVDLVFATTHYMDKPDVTQWVDKNLSLMHCIGKMDLPSPKIAILRSTRATRLGFGDPWNWDIGRGTLQGVGRNFVYIEVPDINDGLINKFPVIIDDGTILMTPEDIEGIKKYVEAGGTFVAQFNTARHLPERADAWPLAAAFGLKVEPKLINEENYNQWPLGKIKFTDTEMLLPSLRGKECEGSGVAIDFRNKIHTGAIGLEGKGGEITPIANWADGTMAATEIHHGKGRLIYLGTPFYARLQDQQGQWVNEEGKQKLLDEMLTGLGVERDSWTSDPGVWAEHWTSKNGIYDLYQTARMVKSGDATVSADISLRRATPVSELEEVTSIDHTRIPVTWNDGRLTLPKVDFGLMQDRIYAAPRADVENAALHWFEEQSHLWRALPPLSVANQPKVIETPNDILPLAESWRMGGSQADTAWTQPAFDDSAWKEVKLGTFAKLGLPEESTAQFRKTITIPPQWNGKSVNLVFDSDWSYGVSVTGHLWINGTQTAKSLSANGTSAFSLDVTNEAKTGKITLAVDVDGKQDPKAPHGRPAGVTGIFYLQAITPASSTTPLSGPWFAAKDVNVLTPVEAGKPASFTYLETHFTLPAEWPAKRVFLETPQALGWLVLNNQVLEVPASMKSLDISGLVRKKSENILRWVPAGRIPVYTDNYVLPAPDLFLAWKP